MAVHLCLKTFCLGSSESIYIYDITLEYEIILRLKRSGCFLFRAWTGQLSASICVPI